MTTVGRVKKKARSEHEHTEYREVNWDLSNLGMSLPAAHTEVRMFIGPQISQGPASHQRKGNSVHLKRWRGLITFALGQAYTLTRATAVVQVQLVYYPNADGVSTYTPATTLAGRTTLQMMDGPFGSGSTYYEPGDTSSRQGEHVNGSRQLKNVGPPSIRQGFVVLRRYRFTPEPMESGSTKAQVFVKEFDIPLDLIVRYASDTSVLLIGDCLGVVVTSAGFDGVTQVHTAGAYAFAHSSGTATSWPSMWSYVIFSDE